VGYLREMLNVKEHNWTIEKSVKLERTSSRETGVDVS
jgi:hypothetical protein